MPSVNPPLRHHTSRSSRAKLLKNWEVHNGFLNNLPYNLLTAIESREGKIEREVNPGFIMCLLRLKSCELFGIANAKLDLETGTLET